MDFSILTILTNTLICLATLVIFSYYYFKRTYTYWNKYDIHVAPSVIPFGSLGSIINRKESFSVILSKLYRQVKEKGEKHAGLFVLLNPIYMPLDPLIIKNIFIKDFNSFTDRSLYHNEIDDPISVNLLTMDGDQWRKMRIKLTPTFTSGKMKKMFTTFWLCGNRLVRKIDSMIETKESSGIKEILACYSTDIVGSCAFGIECNSFENPNSDFRTYGSRIFNFTRSEMFKMALARNFPKVARFLGTRAIPKEVSDFFLKIVAENIKYREIKDVNRNDFFQTLLELEKDEENQIKKRNKVTAQSFVFFNAGFETSSTAMTFALYELALNTHIQDKLRQEVTSILQKYEDNLTYEALMEMEYLNKVIDETLRKYPPVAVLARNCTRDYNIENSNVVIKKGTRVFVSILGIHSDPEYYPNPDKFDPERFNEENKNKRPPCTFLPFGEGPRNCIGLRFGLMQVKIGLAIIVKNFKFTLNPKTGIPRLDTHSFIYRFADEIYLDFERIE
ncbi:probable cytochrome P450 6a19 [Agrilus planipennis]|uniref:Probable cytochrome P450 6a19 n=1 Tax=Agrilus planipennis TaxID=224129 RepID=A0A1W4W447_AGRPL|nr:probable cytochrome P450 6a19 [Agrilus planipennis]XP_025830138.1 probable cytochrome P450 6a19 [Agrilus planipennis]